MSTVSPMGAYSKRVRSMRDNQSTVRKAGRALKGIGNKVMDFDDKYAARVRKDMGDNPLSVALGGTGVRGPYGFSDNASRGTKVAEAAMMGGMAATNLGYRYGLPAAGLTLAGKALMDLTQSYQTSGTIEPR